MIGEWICSHFTIGLFNNKEVIKPHKENKNYTNIDKYNISRLNENYYFHKHRLKNNFRFFNGFDYHNNSLKSIKLNSNIIFPNTIEEIE